MVQAEVCRLRQARGEKVIGYKLGCTSTVVRSQLGAEHAIYGRLYASEFHTSPARLAGDQFANLAIEGELAVRLSEAVPVNCVDEDRILDSVSSMFPVIELHNHVLRGPTRTITELIANNAIHAGFVAPVDDPGLPTLDELELCILINEQMAAKVAYSRWRRSLTLAIGELSSLLAIAGLSLEAGDIILTGSQAELFPIDGDTTVEVATVELGTVSANFAGPSEFDNENCTL